MKCKIALATLLAVGGCATGSPPSLNEIGPEPRAGFDPGPQVRAVMEQQLKDPFSAQYRRVGGPIPGKAQQALLAGGRVESGWGYCYMINAKNSFGGYVGFRPYYFVVRNEQVVGWAANPQLSSWNCF